MMDVVLITVGAAALAAGAYLAWRTRRTLGEVTRGLDSLGRRGKLRLVMTGERWPVRELVRTFNSVATKVHARMAGLDQDREQLLVVLGAMEEAVVAVDQRRRLLFANASANRIFGLEPSSVGRLVPELIRSPQVQDAVEATLRLAGQGAYNGQLTLTSWDSPTRSHDRILSVRGTPLPGGSSSGAVLVFHDVTELRRLERTRQDFVANASHELKTPLASIKAFTETLLDWALHDESVNVRFLERIDEQADRLNLLILDLLSLARLESGEEAFDHAPQCLIPILESCVAAHRGRAETKSLDLAFAPGDLGDEIQVLADEEAIRQIVDNLIDNAIKYTPEGGRVRVSCFADGNTVSIEVADTGIGIPREDLPRIFERFYRVDKARSRELGGTGLGLSIVKHLIQSIGGQVDVISRVGSGSKFTVELPRCLVPGIRTQQAVH
jgi:two-component system, OmpR family, phosphate regulon sensor histidine kinase PhoR